MGVFGECNRSVRTLKKVARTHAVGHDAFWNPCDVFYFEHATPELKLLL